MLQPLAAAPSEHRTSVVTSPDDATAAAPPTTKWQPVLADDAPRLVDADGLDQRHGEARRPQQRDRDDARRVRERAVDLAPRDRFRTSQQTPDAREHVLQMLGRRQIEH